MSQPIVIIVDEPDLIQMIAYNFQHFPGGIREVQPESPEHIGTVRGAGYRFVAGPRDEV